MSDQADTAQVFDCAECHRHIVRIIPMEGIYLCAHCIYLPGWFEDRRLLTIFCPETAEGE